MTLDQTKLPQYQIKHEVVNSSSHFLGLIFGVIATILFIVTQVSEQIPFTTMYPFYIYTLTMMIVFFVSGFYHSRKLGSKSRAVFRLIDHCDIYLFVAGTYTPICLLGITNTPVSISLLIIEWGLAIVGVVLNIIDMNNKVIKVITYIIYILAGWAIIFFYPFDIGVPFNVFLFVLLGGIVYSLGAILYAVGKKKLIWCHSIFHIFVLVAAILQFIGVYFLI